MAIEASKIGADYFDQIDGGHLNPLPSSRIDHRVVPIGPGSGCGKPISECEGTWMVCAPIKQSRMISRRPAIYRPIPLDLCPSDS